MAFKGLEERFNANVKSLYAPVDSPDGGRNIQPYLEWKPTDPTANETADDSRILPVGSTKRDLARLTKLTKSNKGLLFMASQAVLQSGNTFGETRIFNPLFVLGNAIPYVHLRRSLSAPNDFAVKGNASQESPASFDPQIFSAGRLQSQTAKDSISRVATKGGASGLLGLLAPKALINVISGIFSVAQGSTLGVNERPELDVNGQYYSVMLWDGYKKTYGIQSNFASAMANLRIGNFKGAYTSIRTGIDQLLHGVKTVAGGNEPRGTVSHDYDGRRYFFEVDGVDHRYIPNSIQFTVNGDGSEVPVTQLAFLDRRPYVLPDAISKSSTALAFTNNFTVTNVVNNLTNRIKSPFQINLPILGSFNTPLLNTVAQQLKNLASDTLSSQADNAAEESLQFSDLALQTRYDGDERLSFIRDQLQTQKDKSFAYWNANKSKLGYDTSTAVVAGQENNVDPRVRRPSYFTDRMNLIGVINAGENGVDESTMNQIQKYGEDLINVIFYDFVNKKAVPFRAFITGITETINPEFHDTRYVGRTERNIVYSGVTRELNFQLRVHAFSQAELYNVWSKVNYITGLTFPADYDNGFMVPPFVKLTIGSLYKDQPGYIRSLTHTVEDDASWEITDGAQVPHGVVMNVSYSIIEKKQVRTGSLFYPIVGN